MLVACVDVGSTYTKAALVDTGGGLVATASHPTTIGTDVLRGLEAAVDGWAYDEIRVCSSAGGGLRLAVLGYEALVTATAGHKVGLSAGAKVVHVGAGPLASLKDLRAARPDVVLLVGGTDGGDEETITHNAGLLARARFRVPVVLAGNAEVREALHSLLSSAGVPVVSTANVLPRIGVLEPGPARAAIREVFLKHVIGGKKLSRGPRFASLVRMATPDAVLRGVEVLGDTLGADLLVLDVGGATTDVYSVLTPDAARAEVAGTLWRSRTVEGDLGMRWSAPGVVEAAAAERMIQPSPSLLDGACARAADPAFLAPPGDPDEVEIATLAAKIALRRHARSGPDLRDVRLVIGSGGILRHSPPEAARQILAAALTDTAGGWALPRAPRVAVDSAYVLAAAGLLADDHPDAAVALLTSV
ncbi:glutamate mutase L [Hamadaea tsunoensis]|uniref:glutamate mutase L n=1 Tax=Hamadaea tsunoensis TaxID=53368 RepID=UPI000412F4C4|nr:glutamate mutase L [Hamadaea tsunoensis]